MEGNDAISSVNWRGIDARNRLEKREVELVKFGKHLKGKDELGGITEDFGLLIWLYGR